MPDEEARHWALCGTVSGKLVERWNLNSQPGVAPRVLDLGCGMGRNSLAMAQSGLDVYGLDIDEKPLNTAKNIVHRMKQDIKYVQGDMRNMPFESGFFDAVFADNILTLTSHMGMIQTMDEIYRVLRFGGEAFMVFTDKTMPVLQNGRMVDHDTIMLNVQYGSHSAVANFVDDNSLKNVLRGFSVLDKTGKIHGYNPDIFHHFILAMKSGVRGH